MNKGYFKKGHVPWNKNLKGKKYLNHFKKGTPTHKRDNEIKLCKNKNCRATFQSNTWNQKYCSSKCQAVDWGRKNPDKRKAIHIKNYNSKKVKIKNTRYIKNNPEKYKAQVWTRNNIKIPSGQICVICDRELAKYRHHHDYLKINEVVFCCGRCHALLDTERRIKEKMGQLLLKTNIKRDQKTLYYCATSKDGFVTVCSAQMARGGRKKGSGKKTAKATKPAKARPAKKK